MLERKPNAELEDPLWRRGFTNPFRKLYRQLFPGSQLAQRFSSKLANMHSIWHKIMTDVLVIVSMIRLRMQSVFILLPRLHRLNRELPLPRCLL